MRSKIPSRFIPNGKSGTQAKLSYFVTRKQATTQTSGRFDVGRLPKLLLQAEYSTSLLAAILPLSLHLQKREREAAKVLSVKTACLRSSFHDRKLDVALPISGRTLLQQSTMLANGYLRNKH